MLPKPPPSLRRRHYVQPTGNISHGPEPNYFAHVSGEINEEVQYKDDGRISCPPDLSLFSQKL